MDYFEARCIHNPCKDSETEINTFQFPKAELAVVKSILQGEIELQYNNLVISLIDTNRFASRVSPGSTLALSSDGKHDHESYSIYTGTI
jgi:hypothetical protein